MRSLKSIAVFVFLGAMILPVLAFGQVPSIIHYQGLLTDGAGNILPDGDYTFYFTIMNADTGGSVIWGPEQQTLPVTNGIFSCGIGDSLGAISSSVFNGKRWLSVRVDPDAVEMFPRQPFRMAAGAISVAPNSVGSSQIINGSINAIDIQTNTIGQSQIATNGVAGAEIADGSITGTDIASNTIPSGDLQNEPGIAANRNGSSVSTISYTTSMVDLITVSITIPASGYIFVSGMCNLNYRGTTGRNELVIQIDESSGGSFLTGHWQILGSQSPPNTGTHDATGYVDRVYFKSAGTYTFRLEARVNGSPGAGASQTVYSRKITATYFPTSYGSVVTLASAEDAKEIGGALAVTPAGPEGMDLTGAETMYQVDLTQLELKEARLEAELERVRREAAEARLRELEENDDSEDE